MQAKIINEFGGPTIFEMKQIQKPEVIPGHVLIKVAATSVNQIDCKIRSGAVKEISPAFPAILHGDVAGTIVEVGRGVEHLKEGDHVYGMAGGIKGTVGGALAEYMLADEKLIARKPGTFSMTQAAAMPLVTITAWEALIKKVKLNENHRVLIHGGVGGVGHIAVQIAKWLGAYVATTVLSDDDIETAKQMGADAVINAKNETVEEYVSRLTDGGKGFDVVFDTVGGANLLNSFAAAKINGDVVTTAARATIDLSLVHNKALNLHAVFILLPLISGEDREGHGKILEAVSIVSDKGIFRPLLDVAQFSLDSVGAAHAWVESGKAKGKVVLTVP